MNDEKLLKKYQQLEKRLQKVSGESFKKSKRVTALFLTVLIFIWILNSFSIDINLFSVVGVIVAFIVVSYIVYLIIEAVWNIFTYNISNELAIRNQMASYQKVIGGRIQPDNIDYEFTDKFPVVKQKHGYFSLENGKVIFDVQKQDGVFPIVLSTENIAINYCDCEDYGDTAEYRQFAKVVMEGFFKGVTIGEYRELNIPVNKKMNY